MNRIAVRGLSKAYKRYSSRFGRLVEWASPTTKSRHTLTWVLNDISFNVADGESVGILGVNGAGKSTLLKLITGTTQPTTGEVKVHGRMAALLELGMGFHPDFSGRQNVFMAAQLQGLTTEQIENHFEEIEAFADIGDYIDMPVRVYSSGMQVRLAFAVATAIRPDVLIVDEALSVGDVAFQAKCYRRLLEYKELGTTLLLVTHSLDDVVKHCQKAIVLDGGRIVEEGEPREVVTRFRDLMFGRARNAAITKRNSLLPDSDKVQGGPADTSSLAFDLSNTDIFASRRLYQKIEHRWGGGGARITDYVVSANGRSYPSEVEVGERLTIAFRVVFDRPPVMPVYGLIIKTLEGQVVYGTNSELRGVKTRDSGFQAAVTCQFSFPVRLNAGHYFISLGVSEASLDGRDLPIDRRYDAILLNVTSAETFLGLFDCAAECSIE